MHDTKTKNEMGLPQWRRAKQLKADYGFSAAQLHRLANKGLIRTSSVKLPGQTRGVRLYHAGDLEALIEGGIDNG